LKAFSIFSDKPCTCPLEITIKGFYLRACAAQHFNEDKEIIEANLRAAYGGLILLTGATYEPKKPTFYLALTCSF